MDTLTIRGLHKSFGNRKVLRGLELYVSEHSIFGFVGRNGAGKTTTMKAILGLLRLDEGEISVCGEPVQYGETATNRLIGYLPDVPEFYPFMTPREYLTLCGESLGMSGADIRARSEELITLVGLAEEKHRIKGYSRGMKQRLGIAQALLGRPKLLICDEPTSALDPIGRREILDILLSVREQTTVLFSTHILSDVERICTDVAFLESGCVALQGRVDELKKTRCSKGFLIECIDAATAERLLGGYPAAQLSAPHTVTFAGDEEWHAVLAFIAQHRLAIRRAERSEASLETLFQEVAAE